MEQASPFIDIHTHRHRQPGQGLLVVNSIMAGEVLPESPHFRFSLGIHPWQLKTEKACTLEKKFIDQLAAKGLIALGEAGLDRAIAVDFSLQLAVFSMQAELATAMRIPLIIHCVRSFSEIIAVRKTMQSPGEWIVHGFRGNAATAQRLLKHGIRLSLGPALVTDNSPLSRMIPDLPADRLFFETDDTDFQIENIYLKAAALLGLSIDSLKSQVFANFAGCFNIPINA
ncbi:MAG: TatD family hydrolase [Bacteroidetes bacterium]|nr:TatD family hydrolase [Bacteroidota bacterium]